MDKGKLEKGIDRIIRQYTINVVTDEISDYTVLDADVITKMSKELADRIEIDWEKIEKIISPIALSAGINESWICSTMAEEIAEACPIKIKEKEADDEKT